MIKKNVLKLKNIKYYSPAEVVNYNEEMKAIIKNTKNEILKIKNNNKKNIKFHIDEAKRAINHASSLSKRVVVLEKLLKLDIKTKIINESAQMLWIRISEKMKAEEILNMINSLDAKNNETYILITRDNVKSIQEISDENLKEAGLMRIENVTAEEYIKS